MVGYSQTNTTWSATDGVQSLGDYRLTWQARQPGGPSLYAGTDGRHTAVIRASTARGASVVRREALALARFDHPCLPSLLDADLGAKGPWAAATGALTRLGQGAPTLRTLARGLRLHESFGTDLILVLGQRLASALDHSHHAGVVHGHLSADRVLLTLDGPLLVGWHRSRIADPGTAPAPGRTGADVRALAALLGLLGARTDWHPTSRSTAPLLTGDDDARAQAVGHELAEEITDPCLAAVLRPFLTLPARDRAMSAESLLAAFRDRVPGTRSCSRSPGGSPRAPGSSSTTPGSTCPPGPRRIRTSCTRCRCRPRPKSLSSRGGNSPRTTRTRTSMSPGGADGSSRSGSGCRAAPSRSLAVVSSAAGGRARGRSSGRPTAERATRAVSP
ncbi:hypothetical protein SBADM41S_06189 [Streptomyces badius]